METAELLLQTPIQGFSYTQDGKMYLGFAESDISGISVEYIIREGI